MAGAQFRTLSWRDWRSFILAVCLVVGVELSDDLARGFFAHRPVAPAQVNAVRVMEFEQSHGFWIEPALQRFFEHSHHVLGMTIAWSQVVDVVNALYGLAHGLVTCLVALWIFVSRRRLFPFVRNVFLFSTALSVMIYNIFPLAPPRLATGLVYDGHPFHFVDTVFAAGGVNLSFDEYAAMPSLHVAWALIAGMLLALLARPLLLRIVGLIYPLLMTFAVIVTANHYIADCLAAAAVVVIACALAVLVSCGQRCRHPEVRKQLHDLIAGGHPGIGRRLNDAG